jgi:Mrp family chromosome partitioning ATPase
MKTVRFADALRLAAIALEDRDWSNTPKPRLVRDVYGRLRFAVDCKKTAYPNEVLSDLRAIQRSLGAYATDEEVLSHDSFSKPEEIFGSKDWHLTNVSKGVNEDGTPLKDAEVQLLDRQITGQDWLRPVDHGGERQPHRLVFFGLKGGVGRSTALCMTAWGLARAGRNVLLIDLDLESPGLSSLVLPTERVAEFGVVDWLVEDAVGQGEGVLGAMVSASPLGETTPGFVRVVAAMGQQDVDYMAKLARAYADVPSPTGPQRMGTRLRRMVEELERRERPDVVLIDSRAGLHDLAATAITGLADTAFLFATDSEQNWQGYRQLFTHWRRRPDVARQVRERLAIVRALTPKSGRDAGVARFQNRAYQLFAETLYDTIQPGSPDTEDALFHPIEADEDAPHFPLLIDWDERFQEFDPKLRPENGGVTDAQINATFGSLIEWALERVPGAAA